MSRILITGITGNLGQSTKCHFERNGWEVQGVSRGTGLDLTDWEATAQYIAHNPAFDLVFMTHGTQKRFTLEEFNKNAWRDIVDNNLTSAAILSGAIMKHQGLKPGGLVIYCSSIQASQPREGRGLYCIAKAGIEGLTRIMAVEMGAHRRAICLRLGQMTGLMKGMTFHQAEVKRIQEKTPLPWVSFEDIARLVLNLYYQPSMTGEVIEISSGHKFSVWPK